jgi:hypothetical protein
MEHEPVVPLKPEPTTFTRVPMDPEVGIRTIVGTTLKLAEAESPRGPYTVTLYPKAVHTDPVPTLKLAVRTPPLVTVHVGSPVVSTVNTPLVPPPGFA